MVCLSPFGMATNYYVSNSGSDSNSGLTTALPWLTLSKVSGKSFQPGDSILLKRGGIWRGYIAVSSSGNSTNRIVFSNYGTGNKPKILGSQQPAAWTEQGSNIWKSDAIFTKDPYTVEGGVGTGNVWSINSNGSVNTGVHQTSLGALTADNMWYYGSNSIYLYSTSNPATRYTSIEVTTSSRCIFLNHKQYIEINGIDMFFTTVGIYESTYPTSVDVKGLIVRNCELAYFGYPNGNASGMHAFYSNSLIENNVIHDIGRRGISLSITTNNFTIKNIVIQNNTFYHGYHTTSVDLAATGGYSGGVDSLFIRNNFIYDSSDYAPPAYPMQMFMTDQSADNLMTNIFVYNNVFKYASGASMNISGIESVNIYNNTFYGHNEVRNLSSTFLFVTGSHMKVKNNIFYSQLPYDTNNNGFVYHVGATSDFSIIESDYNCYYRTTSGLGLIRNSGTNALYASRDSTSIRTTLGWESHSKFKDPKFVSSTDLSLQSTSPCINRGTNVGITTDMLGNARLALPDIGAYETTDITTDVPIIVLDTENSQAIKVYPNPSQGRFTVRFSNLPAAGSRIEVYDLSGRRVVSRLITASAEEFDLTGQTSGLYLMKSILGSEEKIQKLVLHN